MNDVWDKTITATVRVVRSKRGGVKSLELGQSRQGSLLRLHQIGWLRDGWGQIARAGTESTRQLVAVTSNRLVTGRVGSDRSSWDRVDKAACQLRLHQIGWLRDGWGQIARVGTESTRQLVAVTSNRLVTGRVGSDRSSWDRVDKAACCGYIK